MAATVQPMVGWPTSTDTPRARAVPLAASRKATVDAETTTSSSRVVLTPPSSSVVRGCSRSHTGRFCG